MRIEILRNGRRTVLLASLLCYFFFNQVSVFSATPPNTFYVAKNGSDSNLGSIDSPVLTIKRCVAMMTAGDTCYIRSGSYKEGIGGTYGTVPVGTSFSNAITVKAYNGESVTVTEGSGFGTDSFPMHRSFYWIIDGIIFDGERRVEFVFGGLYGDYVRIVNCEIKNGKYDGLMPHGDYWELLNLNVHHNGINGQDHGLYWTGQHVLVDGGSYHDNSGHGIQIFDSGSVTVNDNIVRNTKIYGNSSDGFGAGLIISAGSRNSVYNNLIYNNGPGRELAVDYRCTDCSVYNNTIVPAPGVTGISINTNGSYVVNTVIKNNIIFTTGMPIWDIGTGTVARNNLSTDPSFTNAAAFDFTLKPTSKAIDAGEDLSSIFSTDFAGKTRPIGGAFDLGAFEYEMKD